MKDVLSYQTETIVRFGGIIDQFVGGCVVAYWPPKSMPQAVSAASAAAMALMKKNQVGSVCFDMRVSFCAADLAVAALGPAGRQSVQVVGRAYTRANSMQSQILGGGIITNAETFLMMSDDLKPVFEVREGFAYSMNQNAPNQPPQTPVSPLTRAIGEEIEKGGLDAIGLRASEPLHDGLTTFETPMLDQVADELDQGFIARGRRGFHGYGFEGLA